VQFIVARTAILLFYHDSVSIWEYPPLSTSKPLFGSPPSCIPPTCSVKTSIDWNGAGASRGPCDWYSGSTQPLLIDLSYDSGLQRLQVSHVNEEWNNSVIVDTVGTYPDITVDTSYRMFECSRFCNDTLVFWCTFCGIIDAHVSRLPSSTLSPILEPVKPMYTRDVFKQGGNIPSTLCPFSGRFANIDDTHKLKIMDFLSESLPVVTFFVSSKSLHDRLHSHLSITVGKFTPILEPLPDPRVQTSQTRIEDRCFHHGYILIAYLLSKRAQFH
jgi:hypothetical protein